MPQAGTSRKASPQPTNNAIESAWLMSDEPVGRTDRISSTNSSSSPSQITRSPKRMSTCAPEGRRMVNMDWSSARPNKTVPAR